MDISPGCEQFEINHKNGDHGDCRFSNLEFITPIDNIRHAIQNGFVQGRNIPKFDNLSNNDIHTVCKMIESGMRDYEIFVSTLILMSAINQIRCGLLGSNISSMYNFPKIETKIKSSTITEETVHQICRYLSEGYSPTEISKMCNVARYIVNDIKFGRNYTYISCQYTFDIKQNPFVSDDIVHKVCKLLENGYTNISIAKQLNISTDIVASIKCGRSGSHISCKYKIPKPKQYMPTMSNEKVEEICKLISYNIYSDIDIATKVGVTYNMVRDIRLGRSYKNISQKYF